jgi:hypothetical protein
MQLKPIAAIAVLLLALASLLVAGCTTNTTSTPTPTAKANVTEALAAKYEEENYTVTKAFSRQTDGTYIGVVRENNSSTPTNVTFLTFNSESDAQSNRATLASDYRSKGYDLFQTNNDVTVSKSVGVCRELVIIDVVELSGIGWGVTTESAIYCDGT